MSDTKPSALLRANTLQTELEELLGFDADSEITGGLDEGQDPPGVCVMLTEEAAERVIALLRKAAK